MSKSRLFFLFAIVALMAYLSFGIRSSVHPPPYDNMHYYNTSQTKVYLDNYNTDGFWQVWGGQIKDFNSVEHGSRFARHIYGDFPPGQPAVTYGLFQLFEISNTESNLIRFNQVIQIVSGSALVLTIFLLCSLFLSPSLSFTYAALCSAFIFLQPAFNYWLDPVFQYQSLSTLYISIIVLVYSIELSIGKIKSQASFLIFILLFLGLITDAIFIFLTLCIFWAAIASDWRREKRNRGRIAAILAAALSASIVNIAYWYGIGFLDNITSLLEYRLGLSASGKEELSLTSFVKMFIRQYSAEMLVIVFSAPLLLVLHQTQRYEPQKHIHIIRISSLLMFLPTLLYFVVFTNAFSSHELFHIHFIFPLLFVNFLLIPKLIDLFSTNNKTYYAHLVFGSFLAVFAYNSAQSIFFQYPQLGVKKAQAANFIKEHYKLGDVFFSPNFRITSTPPQLQSISQTLVYPIQSMRDIDEFDNCMATHFPSRSYSKKIFLDGPHSLMQNLAQKTKLVASRGSFEVYLLADPSKDNRADLNHKQPENPTSTVSCGKIDKPVFGTETVWMVWHPSIIEVLRKIH